MSDEISMLPPCPFCGGGKLEVVDWGNDEQTTRCGGCGIVVETSLWRRRTPPPATAKMIDFLSHDHSGYVDPETHAVYALVPTELLGSFKAEWPEHRSAPAATAKIHYPLAITQLFGIAASLLDILEDGDMPSKEQVACFRQVVDSAEKLLVKETTP